MNVGYLSFTMVSRLYFGLFWCNLSTVSQFFFSDAFFNFLKNTCNKAKKVILNKSQENMFTLNSLNFHTMGSCNRNLISFS